MTLNQRFDNLVNVVAAQTIRYDSGRQQFINSRTSDVEGIRTAYARKPKPHFFRLQLSTVNVNASGEYSGLSEGERLIAQEILTQLTQVKGPETNTFTL